MVGIPRRHIFPLILAIFTSVVPMSAQRGARTVPRGLDQLTREAALIVRGSVVSTRVEPHPQYQNLMTVLVSMQVEMTLKGAAPKSFQFRQYIWDVRDQLDAASYRKGDRILLLLGPVSEYGLRSPVGLGQGRFRISKDATGKYIAANERGNSGLFDATETRVRAQNLRLSPATTRLLQQQVRGPLPLDSIEGAIKEFMGAAR